MSFGAEYTLYELLFKNLDISDNAAYFMLQEKFPISGYNDILKELGCSNMILRGSSKFGNATARETLLLWNQIYKYSL